MKRRSFVKASLLSGAASTALPLLGRAASAEETNQKKNAQEWYELRVYTFKNNSQQQVVEQYFQKAAIPALNRQGSKNIGVFRELKPTDAPKLYVLIPFPSLTHFTQAEEKLARDSAYQQAAAVYLNAPAFEPAYERIESSLLKAFAKMPNLAAPAQKERIFELRRYESASETAGKKKIEMFNDAGEIDIFKRSGLTPVFFGETVIGALRPNLTYMLTYDDMAAHDRNWKTFVSDPDWKRISSMPEYADAKIVSRITNAFLTPAEFSQV